ncbi:abscisic acid receptor PYL8-like [Populus nigra]|nr:abscisic acid receptor PYL8-like [Populus nigra]
MIERLEVISSHTPRHKPLYNSHRPLTREDFRRQRKVILEELQGKREKMNGNCNGRGGIGCVESEYIRRHHTHDDLADHQCSSALVKHIKAPVQLVWSLVRRFDQPQKYKPFISRCVVLGNLEIGSLREVDVRSGLPATTSTERLELLDDDEHILSIRIVGGDHRLKNYSSIISLHPEIIDGRPGTLVIESFVVDVPDGNTKDETCYFVEALIKCNLKSLADVSEHLAVQDRTEPIDCM